MLITYDWIIYVGMKWLTTPKIFCFGVYEINTYEKNNIKCHVAQTRTGRKAAKSYEKKENGIKQRD